MTFSDISTAKIINLSLDIWRLLWYMFVLPKKEAYKCQKKKWLVSGPWNGPKDKCSEVCPKTPRAAIVDESANDLCQNSRTLH